MSDSGLGAVPGEVVEALAEERTRPTEVRLPPREWIKENLFSSWFNTVLTVIFTVLSIVVVRALLAFVFSPDRRWDGTATNMRLFFTYTYPVEQYVRIWFSLGIIMCLTGLSAAAWRAGSQVSINRIGEKTLYLAAGVAVVGILAPFSSSARVSYLLVAASLAVVGILAMRLVGEDQTVSNLLVFIVLAGLGVLSLWVIPYGHHALRDGEVIAESGTVAASTKGPWTVMWLLLIVSYFVGKAIRPLLGEHMRTVLSLLWVASPLVIVFFVMRDPDFDYGHIATVEIPLFLAHAIVGGAILYVLANPKVGEIGRIFAAMILFGAAATFLTPMPQVFRISALALAVFALAAPTFAGDKAVRRAYVGAWVVTIGLLIWLVTAINTPSTLVESGSSFFTGGLAITLIVAVYTLLLSFPLGVLLALARTSKMPIFRVMATTYIEFVRGVPFITILIFFSVMLPLFLPENMEISEIAAVTIGFVLFSAAYLAENVRGGLQSVRRGQYEAADALGMTGAQRTVFIVLPQALRVSIPPLVGQAIATYKETSLLAIIGVFDLLLVARSAVPNQTEFLGSTRDQLVFVSVLYWIGAYSMSRASRKLERQLGVGER